MADYHAILTRTLAGLGETTPELRAKLYDRARATIERQLDTADPPMSAEAIAAQKAHLEAAIASIDSQHQTEQQVPGPQTENVTDAIFDAPAEASSEENPFSDPTEIQSELPPVDDDPVGVPAVEDDLYLPSAGGKSALQSGGLSTMIIVVIGLLIMGSGAAALWINRGTFVEAYRQMGEPAEIVASNNGNQTAGALKPAVSAVKTGKELPTSTIVETAPASKFNQRLNTDGQEVAAAPIPENQDTLPAGVEPSPVTTTRIVVPAISETTPKPGQETSRPAAAGDQTGVSQKIALVAQKGLLYEEGASRDKNSVDIGNVIWSVVQESPGDGLPLEPAIRAKVEINSRGLVLLMTIKRNADQALPASHLIELVFSVPENFSGGNIDKVQRFVFKESEEARGEALVGVPATIADGIFLIALNNLPEALARNTDLMKGRDWIDIPLGYRTGRRALITLEKGVPGERVFTRVFDAWEKAG